MSEQKKETKLKRVQYINGKLACQRCSNSWSVIDLNPERKTVPCSVCGEMNDIREAIKRGFQ